MNSYSSDWWLTIDCGETVGKMVIPQWLIDEGLDGAKSCAIRIADYAPYISRETAKAVLVVWSTEFGRVTLWCPKSVLRPLSEVEAAESARFARFEEASRKYDQLVAVLKPFKIGIRSGLRVNTLVEKARGAGHFDAIASMVTYDERRRAWRLA